jgi:hypothetical protein
MESLNAIVVQGSDENALSAVAGSEACAGKLVADKRLRGTEFTFIQQREKLTRHPYPALHSSFQPLMYNAVNNMPPDVDPVG